MLQGFSFFVNLIFWQDQFTDQRVFTHPLSLVREEIDEKICPPARELLLTLSKRTSKLIIINFLTTRIERGESSSSSPNSDNTPTQNPLNTMSRIALSAKSELTEKWLSSSKQQQLISRAPMNKSNATSESSDACVSAFVKMDRATLMHLSTSSHHRRQDDDESGEDGSPSNREKRSSKASVDKELKNELEDIMNRAEEVLRLSASTHHSNASTVYAYEEDDTWDDFCEDLPLEEE